MFHLVSNHPFAFMTAQSQSLTVTQFSEDYAYRQGVNGRTANEISAEEHLLSWLWLQYGQRFQRPATWAIT